MKTVLLLFFAALGLASARTYCQPEDSQCWPTSEEIEEFKSSLSPETLDCLNDFPTFTSQDDKGPIIWNQW